MRKPSIVDVKNFIRTEQFRIENSFEGLVYDRQKKEIEIWQLQVDDDTVDFDISDEIHSVRFINCSFRNVTLRLFLNFEVIITFHQCKFNKINFSGNYGISLEITDPDEANEIEIDGFLKTFLLSGGDAKIKRISINNRISPSSRPTSIEIYRRWVDHVVLTGSNVKIRLGACVINNLLLRSNVTGELIIDRDCKIYQMKVISLTANVNIVSSKIEILLFQGHVKTNANFNARNATFGLIDMIMNAELNEFKFLECRIYKVQCIQGWIHFMSFIRCVIGMFDLDLSDFGTNKLYISGKGDYNCQVGFLLIHDGVLSRGSAGQASTIQLESFKIASIEFVSFINQGNVFVSGLNGVSANDLIDLRSIINADSEATVYKVEPPTLKIFDSDLGKINFISCDFSKNKLIYRSSKIVEIFLAGTSMPVEIQGDLENQQTGYAQLKKVFDNRGDSVASIDYQKRELNAHFQSLMRRNWTRRGFWEWVTLGLNKCTNDFGTSWWRTLSLFLLSMGALFIFHNIAIGYGPGSYNEVDELKNFWEILFLFPEFLVPLHKADYIPDTVGLSVTNWSRLWDFVGKVWGGYLIYQFVQAFRKYGRR